MSFPISLETVTITGHRPEDLPHPEDTYQLLEESLISLSPSHLIQGMAAGVDLASAEIAYKLGIPYTAARPWGTHSPRRNDATRYATILDNAHTVLITHPQNSYPGAWAYHKRNQVMIDEGDYVFAVWSGKQRGGTASAVKYALQKGVPVYQLNPTTLETRWVGLPSQEAELSPQQGTLF